MVSEIEKTQLGRFRCDDDTGASVIDDRSAHGSGRLFGGFVLESACLQGPSQSRGDFLRGG